MPLYEFRCPSGHDFEKFYRSISSAPSEEQCPECGKLAERRMSLAGLVFKGSGFYITDYGKDGKKAEREAAGSKTDQAKPAGAAAPDASAPAGGAAAEKPAAPETKAAPPEKKSTPSTKTE